MFKYWILNSFLLLVNGSLDYWKVRSFIDLKNLTILNSRRVRRGWEREGEREAGGENTMYKVFDRSKTKKPLINMVFLFLMLKGLVQITVKKAVFCIEFVWFSTFWIQCLDNHFDTVWKKFLLDTCELIFS